jgi:uncharacterized DUF497 family protein/uncharacterized protein (DUF4415 family)
MFEWDEDKNRTNLEKHGIAFEDVLSVFANREALTLEDRRRDYGEVRYMVLCPLEGVLVHVTYTVRGASIRLISARRASRRRSGTMSTESLTRALLTQDGRVLIEQPDGSYRPAKPRTDWERVRVMPEAEIEAAAASDPDALPLDQAFWRTARVAFPPQVRKKHTGLRIDEDVLAWFRAQGPGYQTRMNAVLRAYVDAQKREGR